MQERTAIPDSKINSDLLRGLLGTPMWWWVAVIVLALIVGAGVASVAITFNMGLGLWEIHRPIMWGIMIVNFVFWIGISHAGVMISAILRLSYAEWRRPVTRAAEILTVFSLMIAMVHPLIHAGRPWRLAYWFLPYDFPRGIWPSIRSPAVWDPSAIFTYLTGSSLFVLIALIPDMAVARDRTTGWRHYLYSVASLGFRGTPRQWKLQTIAGILLSGLLLPVFVSVHSIVSWDFATMVSVGGWHATIFAPYFVIGAVLSGVSAVVTVMALMRWLFHWEDYIRPEHFDALGRLLIAIAMGWLFFFVLEFFVAIYTKEPAELALREMQLFQWPYNVLFTIFIFAALIIPVPIWVSRKMRRNITVMFITSILVNVGMWLERFIIIIPSLARKQDLTFVWSTYHPSIFEISIVAASFALVGLLLLLFSKVFPLMPLFEQKEGQRFAAQIRVGRRSIPGVVREE